MTWLLSLFTGGGILKWIFGGVAVASVVGLYFYIGSLKSERNDALQRAAVLESQLDRAESVNKTLVEAARMARERHKQELRLITAVERQAAQRGAEARETVRVIERTVSNCEITPDSPIGHAVDFVRSRTTAPDHESRDGQAGNS